ncbi:hypothetical protein AHF37_00995 [Paragonimus kellicotti]|nr:hypothetical protein AHF37_00995 [Paragonimus kellicotti]
MDSCRRIIFSLLTVKCFGHTFEFYSGPFNSIGNWSDVNCPKKNISKPVRPAPPSGFIRAASAENRRVLYSWTPNNSPCPDSSANALRAETKQTSSELSLCSSISNGIDSSSLLLEPRVLGFTMPKGQPHAIALYDFDTQIDGDLQFKRGDILMLEEVVDEAWYRGRSVNTGQVGIFPMNHVEVRIPLDSGLYTNSQPKPMVFVNSNTINGSTTSVKRQPSLQAKQKSKEVIRSPSPSSAIHPIPASRDSPQVNPSSSPVNHAKMEFPHQVIRSSTPSIINSLRPMSHGSVSQLAQTLEHRGIIINRMGYMPSGAKSLFPAAMKQTGSSAPNERHKRILSPTDFDAPTKQLMYPTPQMVETPLVMIARERNRLLGRADLYSTSTVSNPEFTRDSTPHENSLVPHEPAHSEDKSFRSMALDRKLLNKPEDEQRESLPSVFDKEVSCESDVKLCSVSPIDVFATHCEPPEAVLSTADLRSTVVRPKPSFRLANHNNSSWNAPPATSKDLCTPVDSAIATASDASTVSPDSSTSTKTCETKLNGVPMTPETKATPSQAVRIPITTTAETSYLQVDENGWQRRPKDDAEQWLLVLYDYTGTAPGDLTVKAGQVIRCLDPLPKPSDMQALSIPDRWLHCVTWFNVEGQVPSTFVRRILQPQELERWMQYRPRAEAIFEFRAETAGDLSLKTPLVMIARERNRLLGRADLYSTSTVSNPEFTRDSTPHENSLVPHEPAHSEDKSFRSMALDRKLLNKPEDEQRESLPSVFDKEVSCESDVKLCSVSPIDVFATHCEPPEAVLSTADLRSTVVRPKPSFRLANHNNSSWNAPPATSKDLCTPVDSAIATASDASTVSPDSSTSTKTCETKLNGVPMTPETKATPSQAVRIPITTTAETSYLQVDENGWQRRPKDDAEQWLLVLYDYTGTAPGDLTVKVIRCLDPLPKPSDMQVLSIPDRWLHCVTWFNVEGQVPSTFVRRILQPQELERWMQYRPRAEAIFEFRAETAGDLSLKVNYMS